MTLASIGDAVIATDTEGRVTFLNAVAQDLTGWTPGRRRGQAAGGRVRHPQRADPPAGREPGREGAAGGRGRRPGEPHGPDRQGRDRAAHRRQRRPDPGCGGRDDRRRADLPGRDRAAPGGAAAQRPARRDPRPWAKRRRWRTGPAASCGRCARTSAGTWACSGRSTRAGEALACRQSWHRPDVPVDEFEKASCSRTFEKGEGLPGRVWASGKPAWILDIAQDANFPRLASAVRLRPAQRLRLPRRRRRPDARRDRVLHPAHPGAGRRPAGDDGDRGRERRPVHRAEGRRGRTAAQRAGARRLLRERHGRPALGRARTGPSCGPTGPNWTCSATAGRSTSVAPSPTSTPTRT